ncbi:MULTISPECIES: MFS transporter [unclassified Pseudonocardia]|uniref:MFS transporter n=1 Tax=unclassified Pseudonocardia TaxID=2619320 RepID=UPI0001FFE5D6|nr:MFS transporter [Pseudonocardia sp. Ae707_Ps1]OLM20387.1 permease of the major facilitator superfamily [Pseudonocardia sp. Ae707_Ps1]
MQDTQDRPPVSPEQERRVLVAGTVGSVVEWYDFGLYGAASALVIGPLFFSGDLSPAAATMASFATFAIGFFARPLGGLLIANFGDRLGRKPALVFTLVLMGGSTFLMGCLPTYEQIGLWAPALLVMLRLLQGAGAGAELAGTMTMISETIRPSRLGFGTAMPNAATAIGSALGIVAFLVVALLPGDVLLTWGWRVPFWLSAVILAVAYFIRHRVEETPEFVDARRRVDEADHRKVPMWELFREHRGAVLLGFGAMVGHQAMSYITTTFALTYIRDDLGMPQTLALSASLTASVVGALLGVGGGILTDRLGATRVFTLGASYCLLMSFPLFLLLGTTVPGLIVLALVATYSVSFGLMAGAQGLYLVGLFPAEVRFSGVATCRELAGTLIGGPAPLIAAALVAAAGGAPWLCALFLAACCAVSVACLLLGRGYSARRNASHVVGDRADTRAETA